ncbi:MAG: LysR family transcriptional regulator [Rhodospirillales bacterium]|jgi:DNA-binding transcriptional LysR family regulator|nr:LysR family transcriptional regulator [Rhodospirillales bacterium]MBT4006851.1 LysR family transcriptional regulator [Rhodospirillales bacterium]MBT5076562.1 LysR family transcriptional regulator [Rhodospirillales bacterium]MBT5113122.1 LysR family transcriptional regulator [Rhodospirillales bacterium]MBT5672998.1 LysR family transcriptional regulator [Rhodospirillales bacterium]
MDWDKLRIFHAVAQAGSFTHAGETLNLSQSAISRQISALEHDLDVVLFHRHARGLVLTEQGELLFATSREVVDKIADTQNKLSESTDRPSGPLKVTATVALGSIWLTPRVKEFIDLYPDISLTLLLSDEEINIGMREADVAIRLNTPRQPDLVRRPLMAMHNHVYAAPEYLQAHGMPQSIEELSNHNLVVYGEALHPPTAHINWLEKAVKKAGVTPNNTLKVNNIYGIYRAVQSGVGIAALPDYTVRQISNMVRILPELEGPTYDSYFVYPEELRQSKRVAVFRDFLLGKISETRF